MSDVLDLPIRALLTGSNDPRAGRPVIGGGARDVLGRTLTGSGSAERRTDEQWMVVMEAVFAMAARELAAYLRVLPVERAAEALRQRNPGAAVAGLLADAALEGRMAADSRLAAAVIRGSQRKGELLDRAGGALTSGEIARHLGISRQAVDKRRVAGSLLAVRMPSGDWVYPALQLTSEGGPVAALPDVLAAFGGLSPWMQLDHLLADDPALSHAAIHDGAGSAAPRSALRALREDGLAALSAVLAALAQARVSDE